MEKINGVIIEHVPPMSNQYGGMTTIEDEIIFPDGCYPFLPEFEAQTSLYFESNTCVSQSYNNAQETSFAAAIANGKISAENVKWLTDEGYFKNGKINFNDRALAIISKTNPNKGNSGEAVADAAEENGLAAETAWPWDWRERDPKINNKESYWNDFQLPPNVTAQMAEFKKRFELLHEWVERKDWSAVEKKGSLQGYVNAWHERNGKYYNPYPGKTNHAVQPISSATIEIFDTYHPSIKQLEQENDLHCWILKINVRERAKIMPHIENNTLIFTTGHGGQFGLYLDNRIIVDDLPKILAMWMMRNNGATAGKTKTLTQEDWDKFNKTDLKNNSI
jgi:hypothetical protein